MTIASLTTLPLEPGAAVEVRTHFTGRWSPGFEVDAVIADQVRVRRRSDGVVLPVAVNRGDVRADLAEAV